MIFIAGVQPKTRRIEETARTCPSCGSPQAFLKRIDHYLSVFFVPIIPIRRGTPMLSCENCGAAVTEADQAVGAEELQGVRRCRHCGRILDQDFAFCPYCGTGTE